MPSLRLGGDEARDLVRSPDLHRTVGPAFDVPGVVVESDGSDLSDVAAALSSLPVVSIAVGPARAGEPWDLITADPDPLIRMLGRNPIAAVTTAQILRLFPRLSSPDARLVESLAYSTLQAGPEHARWLSGRGRRVRNDREAARVEIHDRDDHIDVVMTRPRLRNMIDAAMRDQLVDAFKALAHDPRPIRLLGRGRVFCAGGDLAEFGSRSDPASANLNRLGFNVAPWLAAVAERLTAVIDGPCVGAGVELAALARRVSATAAASFRLPETSMGLMPGAGGTVSIPARIGTRRTLEWLLRDNEIDVETALEWGLVDEIATSAQLVESTYR